MSGDWKEKFDILNEHCVYLSEQNKTLLFRISTLTNDLRPEFYVNKEKKFSEYIYRSIDELSASLDKALKKVSELEILNQKLEMNGTEKHIIITELEAEIDDFKQLLEMRKSELESLNDKLANTTASQLNTYNYVTYDIRQPTAQIASNQEAQLKEELEKLKLKSNSLE